MSKVLKAAGKNKLFKVHAGIEISGRSVHVCFLLDDMKEGVRKPLVDFNSGSPERKSELWRSTCFEFFISRPDSSSYFEVNLSPWGAWDAYHFFDYRTPQPPERTSLIQLQDLRWAQGKKLSAVLALDSDLDVGLWDCSLACVLELRDTQKKYFASKHTGVQPDFHLRNSFVHRRG
jgi:hypothetical protein